MNKQDEMAALLVSMRRKVSEAKKYAVTVTYIDAVELEKLLDYTESLEPLAKEAPFKLGMSSARWGRKIRPDTSSRSRKASTSSRPTS